MAVVSYDPGGLIAGDYPTAHRTVTIVAGADLTRGAVLGRVTASDKYALSASAAVDGSQTPIAILAEDAAAASVDVVAPAFFSGEFAADQMSFGTGHTADTVEASVRQNGHPMFVRKRV